MVFWPGEYGAVNCCPLCPPWLRVCFLCGPGSGGSGGGGGSEGCGDERDQIIQEYVDFGVNFVPTCGDFTQDASSAHFSFAELNTGDYSWAIIRTSLLDGLECTRSANGDVPLIINSGYRNPAKQNRVNPGAINSRHVHGDAADIASNASTWQPLHDAGKSCSACVEPEGLSGAGHVHVDWRGSCPPGW